MTRGREDAQPFVLWLQKDVDADLVELIGDAKKHRRAGAEVRRLLRLGLAAESQARRGTSAENGRAGLPHGKSMPHAQYRVPEHVRAVFIFGDVGMLSAFRNLLQRRGVIVPAAQGGYRQYRYTHTGSIGWPVLVRNLREGLVYEFTDECGFFTAGPFDEPTDGPIDFDLFYGMLDALLEVSGRAGVSLPSRTMLEEPKPEVPST